MNKALFCYLKSFYFYLDSNHLFSIISSSSGNTLVEASHHQFVQLLLTIVLIPGSYFSSFSTSTTFLSVFVPFFLSLRSDIGSIKILQCFMYKSFLFLTDPKNHSISSLRLYFSQPFLLSS